MEEKERLQEPVDLDPKNDVVFKRIFGKEENKDILISFLNAVFEHNKKYRGYKIQDLEYIDPILGIVNAVDDKTGGVRIKIVQEKLRKFLISFRINIRDGGT